MTLRPPPSSILFPYTTLFRSTTSVTVSTTSTVSSFCSSAIVLPHLLLVDRTDLKGYRIALRRFRLRLLESPPPGLRSEEHTSELQSRENLVCRLLLEKKNKK